MKAIILDLKKRKGLPEKDEEEEEDLEELETQGGAREDQAVGDGVLGFGGRLRPSRVPTEGLSCYPHGSEDHPASTTTITSSGQAPAQLIASVASTAVEVHLDHHAQDEEEESNKSQ